MSYLRPIIGIDLGPLAICCVIGTWNAPVLLRDPAGDWELRTCGDMTTACAYLDDLLQRRGPCVLACEETFSAGTRKKPWLRDVGRAQEGQAGFLEGMYGGRVEFMRVQPQLATDAMVAWDKFGRPTLRGERLGEHLKDCLAVALAAMVKIEDESRELEMVMP